MKRIWNAFCLRYRRYLYRRIKGLQTGKRVIFQGPTLIDIRHGGKVIIGDDVTLNSTNRGYHMNMHSPVKTGSLLANIQSKI